MYGITGSCFGLTNFCSKDPFCKVKDLKHNKKSPLRVVLSLNLFLETDLVLRNNTWFIILETLHVITKN